MAHNPVSHSIDELLLPQRVRTSGITSELYWQVFNAMWPTHIQVEERLRSPLWERIFVDHYGWSL